MAALFWAFVLLFVVCVATMLAVDYRVERATSWKTIDRWLVVGTYAAPAGILFFGAAIGAGLAWWMT